MLIDKAKRGMLHWEGKTYDEAQRLLRTTLINHLRDSYRRQEVRQRGVVKNDLSDMGDLISGPGEASESEIDHAAIEAAKAIQRQWPDAGITEEDVRTYLHLISEDYSDSQIISQKMLPFLHDRSSFTPGAWTKYKKEIIETVKRELKTASLHVRDLDEADTLTASETTQDIAASLVVKTALEPSSVLRLNYEAQLITLQSTFMSVLGEYLNNQLRSLHEELSRVEKYENVSGFLNWDYGSPRQQSDTWSIRVWLKSSPILPDQDLDANLNVQIKFGDKVDIELVMGNRTPILKKSMSAVQASPSVIALYCREAGEAKLRGH